VLLGQKRSFCIEDTKRASDSAPDTPIRLQSERPQRPGRAGRLGRSLRQQSSRQWIDITDLPTTGDFDLCVTINTAGLLPRSARSNDRGCVP
jgi:hypothetical protein